ncbi:unnamed protein product [Owenia fusiformis]|uniref:C2H2-type domain-containing protein n=1 Tax=Owenia fusiformis TaxID=6347 RepID=A0A8S4N7E2_OWEFU|nr:unnamed protein product [Owenia fusiformis]
MVCYQNIFFKLDHPLIITKEKFDLFLFSFSEDSGLSMKQLTRNITQEDFGKKYSCGMCSKVYSLKWSLKDHIRRHTGENLRKCELCLKTFIKKSHYIRHLRIHTGEKPFKCDICSKTYRHSFHLTTHVKRKHTT